MEPMGHRQRQLQHRHFRQITGIEDHQIGGPSCTVPDEIEHPAVVFGFSTGTAHHQWFTHESAGCSTPGVGGTAAEIQLLNRLQRIVAGLPLGHRHPGELGTQPLPLRVHHGELAGAL